MRTPEPASPDEGTLALKGHLHAIELAIGALALAAGVKRETIAAIRDLHQERALLAFAEHPDDARLQSFYDGLVERLDSVVTTLQAPAPTH